MASPVQVPPLRHRRSFAGPVVLIVLGVIFLLGNMEYVSWGRLAHWFSHYWPVLLIIWGVIKLVEYQRAQSQGYRASGIGVGGVFLIIMLVFLGLAATQASRFNWGELRDQVNIDDSDFNTWFGHNYNYDDQLNADFPAGATLHANNTRGAINISDSTDDKIHVTVRKRIGAESQSDADKWNAGTKTQFNVSGNVVTLNANNQGAGDHSVTIDMDVSLPRKAAAVLSTRGDVSVIGRDGDVQITSQHGEVSASDITGKVSLSLDHSSARISQVSSDVSIEGRSNDVSIEDVKGGCHLDGEFMESLKLSRIAQSVVFRSSRTEMQLEGLKGDLDLDSGVLQASDVAGPVRLTTRSKDVRLNGVSGDVRLQDENGSVEVRMAKLGSVQLENHSGDISLYVPDKAGFQVDAHARNGEIETDFSDMKVNSTDDQATATGSVNGGGPHMIVNNEHGTIEIRKGSSAPEPSESPKPPKPPRAPKAPRAPGAHNAPEVTEN
jgi:DUF4097 and DUF4098 domain-containing protein YvlB